MVLAFGIGYHAGGGDVGFIAYVAAFNKEAKAVRLAITQLGAPDGIALGIQGFGVVDIVVTGHPLQRGAGVPTVLLPKHFAFNKLLRNAA